MLNSFLASGFKNSATTLDAIYIKIPVENEISLYITLYMCPEWEW